MDDGSIWVNANLNADQIARMHAQIMRTLHERAVFLGERVLPTSIVPYLVPRETLTTWGARSEGLIAAAERFVRDALEDRDLFDRLRLDPRVEELVRTDPGYRRAVVVCRPDALIGRQGPTFIELNCDCPSMMTYADAVSECLSELPELRDLRARAVPESRTERLLEALLDCYREHGGTAASPTIAIAEWPGGITSFEDHLMAQRFRAKGHPSMVCDPRSFQRVGSRLEVDGAPVHIVYRRMSSREVFARQSEIEPLLRAYRDGAVCMVNPLRSHMASTKALLAGLWEQRATSDVTASEPALLPPTHLVNETWEDRLRDRGDWVLKRAESAGADDVLLPEVADDAAWTEALVRARREPWVAQRILPIPTLETPEGRAYYNWNPFVLGGRYGGSVVCASDGPLVSLMKGARLLPVWAAISADS